MTEARIRVLVVDDHAVVRKGLRALLATEPGMEVVAEAADGESAVAEVERVCPDVVVMDLVMPGIDGAEAIRRIRANRPEANVVVLTSFGSDRKLFPAVKAGAVGYMLKDCGPDELIRAIRQAARGQTSLHPAIARRLLSELTRERRSAAPVEPLTERESELLRQVARGLSNEQIGETLHISEATVRTHVSHILAKLGVANRTQAALYALREGIATLEEVAT